MPLSGTRDGGTREVRSEQDDECIPRIQARGGFFPGWRGGRAEALAGVRRSVDDARTELAHRRRVMHSGQDLCSLGMPYAGTDAPRASESMGPTPREATAAPQVSLWATLFSSIAGAPKGVDDC